MPYKETDVKGEFDLMPTPAGLEDSGESDSQEPKIENKDRLNLASEWLNDLLNQIEKEGIPPKEDLETQLSRIKGQVDNVRNDRK